MIDIQNLSALMYKRNNKPVVVFHSPTAHRDVHQVTTFEANNNAGIDIARIISNLPDMVRLLEDLVTAKVLTPGWEETVLTVLGNAGYGNDF
jgi:hypothetical protein